MNSKSLSYLNLNAQTPYTYVKLNMVKHPSAYVLFSDVRNRSTETPYYSTATPGTGNWTTLATPQCYTTRFSSRHNNGGMSGFGDGHAAYYKYNVVVSSGGTVGAGYDPVNPNINWDVGGVGVPSGGASSD